MVRIQPRQDFRGETEVELQQVQSAERRMSLAGSQRLTWLECHDLRVGKM